MKRLFWVFLFQVAFLQLTAQDVVLPEDLRQHNLTQFNSSLLNPVFSLDRNNPQAISLWSRWQWQTIDGDPTSVFLSYTGKINSFSAFSVGFVQHNTGTYLNTGGVLNYAYSFNIQNNTRLSLGVNLIGFKQNLADDRFLVNDNIDLPELMETNEFIMLLTPGALLEVNNFDIAFALENALDLTSSSTTSGDTNLNFIGMVSNDFPIFLFDGVENTFLRPSVYVKTISNADAQFGLNALLSASKFWFQGGYNSFYGPSVGLGVTFARNISIGGLLEFPTGSDIRDESSTFELVLSYHIGNNKNGSDAREPDVDVPEEVVESDDTAEPEVTKRERVARQRQERDSIRQLEIERRNRIQDSINRVKTEKLERVKDSISQIKKAQKEALLAEKRQRDSLATLQRESVVEKKRETRRERLAKERRERDSLQRLATEQRNMAIRDSINRAKAEAERIRVKDSIDQAKKVQEKALLAEQKQKDSIAALQNKEVEVAENEKYEEVKTAEGLQPGFYLIANVFGTKTYYENFMQTLMKKGLEPKSFYRESNGYNYVYLGRYNTIDEARRARDSKFDGQYPDKTWIFRVRGD